jgi:hypothetical protein
MFRITSGRSVNANSRVQRELEYFKDVSNYVALRSGAKSGQSAKYLTVGTVYEN